MRVQSPRRSMAGCVRWTSTQKSGRALAWTLLRHRPSSGTRSWRVVGCLLAARGSAGHMCTEVRLPIATVSGTDAKDCHAGFQFGVWAGQLGDGRAVRFVSVSRLHPQSSGLSPCLSWSISGCPLTLASSSIGELESPGDGVSWEVQIKVSARVAAVLRCLRELTPGDDAFNRDAVGRRSADHLTDALVLPLRSESTSG
jgi:hypothetical protein